VLVHGVTAFGVGGLVGGLVATWWQRRRLEPLPEPPLPSSDANWLSIEADDSHPGSLDDDPEATQTTMARVRADDEES